MIAMSTALKESNEVSLLCTPGQALGTAATVSITEHVGMAFSY